MNDGRGSRLARAPARRVPDHETGGEVRVVAVGDVDRSLLEFLVLSFRESVGLEVRLGGALSSPRAAFDPRRRQHDSSIILASLLRYAGPGRSKVLGLTGLDLFIPVFTFVFGEAQLGGRAAVVSTHRLREEFYGLPASEDVLYRRVEKEATHEIGHCFGLLHCPDHECVMHACHSVDRVDLKSRAFCPSCSGLWRAAAGAS